jgi:peptide/nickel transport system ATP-binding protein
MNHDIIIKNLRVHFPTKEGPVRAVDEVSITFHYDEITALIGETGCGKSVLGLSLLGLLPKEARVEGEVLYRGEPVLSRTGKNMRKYRNKILSLIPQNPSSSLNPTKRIGKQIVDALVPSGSMSRQDAEREAGRSLSRLKLSGTRDYFKLFPFQLSGGMRERVLVSIGTVRRPVWLLSDEPTKGLDKHLQEEITTLFEEISVGRGRGTILITHDVHLALSISSRVLVMYGGHIIEDTRSDTLLERPLHPYTEALLQALPENGFKPMPGAPLGIGSLPPGCRFYPRCTRRMDRCASGLPPLFDYGGEQKVRCFLYD